MKKFLIASVGGIPPTSVLPPGARINFARADRRFLKKVTLRLVTAWLFAQMLIASTIFGQVLTHGPAVRDVTASEAKVFVRTDQAASVTLCYGSDPNLDTYLVSTAFVTSSPSDFIKVISLSDLIPKTSYYLNVLVNGVPQLTGPPYPSFTTFPPTPWGTLEQYGTTSNGVALRWTAFVPHDGGRHPAVLVLHAGGFKSGDAGPDNVSEDLAAAGFLALSTEYRLGPPHYAMTILRHRRIRSSRRMTDITQSKLPTCRWRFERLAKTRDATVSYMALADLLVPVTFFIVWREAPLVMISSI